MQSGDILHLIDAGHAKLIHHREDGSIHEERFCATCSQVRVVRGVSVVRAQSSVVRAQWCVRLMEGISMACRVRDSCAACSHMSVVCSSVVSGRTWEV